MFRIDDPTATPTLPTPAAAGTPGYFANATIVTRDWLNVVQEELVAASTLGGGALSKTTRTQLRDAIMRVAGGNVSTITATGSLTPDQAGLILVSAASGNVTLTLPAANAGGGLPLEFTFVRTDASSNTITIERAGANTIEGQTTLAMPLSSRITLRGDGSSAWRVTGEVNMGRTLARPGWYRFPGGLLMQWGVASVGAGATATITYPVAFPNAALAGSVTAGGTSPSAAVPVAFNITAAPASNAQFQISNNGASAGSLDWIVLGH